MTSPVTSQLPEKMNDDGEDSSRLPFVGLPVTGGTTSDTGTTTVTSPQQYCCQLHGDSSAYNFTFFPAWERKEIYIEQTIVPLSRFAFTQGLQRSMVDDGTNQISVSVMFVCKLHAASSCCYGEGCKFVHVCRQFVQEKLSQVVQPLSSNPTTKRGGAGEPHSVAVGNTDVAGAKKVLPPPSDIHFQMQAPLMPQQQPIQTQQVLQYPPHMNLQQVQQPQMIFQSQQIQQQPQQPSQMVQHPMQPIQQHQLMVYQTTPQQPLQYQSQVAMVQQPQAQQHAVQCLPSSMLQPPPSTFAPAFVVGGPTQQAPNSTLTQSTNRKHRKYKRSGRGGRGGQQNQNPTPDGSLVVGPELANAGSFVGQSHLNQDLHGRIVASQARPGAAPTPLVAGLSQHSTPMLMSTQPPPISMASGAQTHLMQQPQAQQPVLVSGQQHAVQCPPSSVMQPPHLPPQPPALLSFVAGAQQAPVQPLQGEYQQLSGSVSLNFSTSSPSHQPPPMTGALTHLLHTAPQQQ